MADAADRQPARQPRQVHLLRPRGSPLGQDPAPQDQRRHRRSTRRWRPSKTPTSMPCRTCSRASTSTARSASARSTTTRSSNFIQNFEKIPLRDENFEFPDLLGAAYEYLIKYFADSAGKKGGEFYTPADVVRTLVEIVEPQDGMSIYDPTCGSGGMLIQTRDYVQRVRRRPARPLALRPGEHRHHLVHLQDEHAPARHLACRHPPGGHDPPAAAHGRERRAEALRPGHRQSARSARTTSRRTSSSRAASPSGCPRRARRPT